MLHLNVGKNDKGLHLVHEMNVISSWYTSQLSLHCVQEVNAATVVLFCSLVPLLSEAVSASLLQEQPNLLAYLNSLKELPPFKVSGRVCSLSFIKILHWFFLSQSIKEDGLRDVKYVMLKIDFAWSSSRNKVLWSTLISFRMKDILLCSFQRFYLSLPFISSLY